MIVKSREYNQPAEHDDPSPATPEDACLMGAPVERQAHLGSPGANRKYLWCGPMDMTKSAQTLAAAALF